MRDEMERLTRLALQGDEGAIVALRRAARRRGEVLGEALADAVAVAGEEALAMLRDRFEALEEREHGVRALAVEEVARLPIAVALRRPLVARALDDPAPVVRAAALVSLPWVEAAPRVADALVRTVVARPTPEVARACQATLALLCGEDAGDDASLRAQRDAWYGYQGLRLTLERWGGRCGLDALDALDARLRAAGVAPRLDDARGWIERALRLLGDPWEAARLGDLRDLTALSAEPLERVMTLTLAWLIVLRLCPWPRVRLALIERLLDVSEATAVMLSRQAPIAALGLRGEAFTARQRSGHLGLAEALRHVDDADPVVARAALGRCAESPDAVPGSRLRVLLARAGRGDAEAAEVLARLSAPTPSLGERALAMVADEGARLPAALLARLLAPQGVGVVERLAQRALRGARGPRRALLEAMAFLPYPEAADRALTALTHHADHDARAAARAALQRLAAQRAWRGEAEE